MRQMFNYGRHPLSQLNWKGDSSSSTSQATSSTTQETGTTQSGSNDIAVSQGGSVEVNASPIDTSIISSVLSFAGDVLNGAGNAVTQAETNASAATQEAFAQSNNVANNSQQGALGILENPVFIGAAVVIIGLVVWYGIKNK